MIRGKRLSAVLWACLGVILCASQTAARADTRAGKIDALLLRCYGRKQFSGVALVMADGKLIYRKGFGLANREWNIPNSPDTKFQLGSLTKQFTAMLIMQMVQRGQLHLEDKITDYFPDFKAKDAEKITLYQLLTHTSGLTRNFFPYDASNTAAHFRLMSETPLDFTPGTRFGYSNSGFFLLGLLAEKVGGKSYEALLHENILDPLGMKDTGVNRADPIIPKRAVGYEWLEGFPDGDRLKNGSGATDSLGGAGSLYSTGGDLQKWSEALETDRLLSAKYRKIYLQPHLSSYACGIGAGRIKVGTTGRTVTVYSHTGRTPGFTASFTRIPADHHLILLFNNTGDTPIAEISTAIRNILYGQPYRDPPRSLAGALSEDLRTQSLATALARFHARTSQRTTYVLAEDQVNLLGYRLLREGRLREAVAVLGLDVENFPHSWNALDSLAEAQLKAGDRAAAIQNYQKSVALNPQNTNGQQVLKRLMLH